MKKIKLVIIFLFIVYNVNSQWKSELINNNFDGKFKISYTKTNNYGYLAMEEGEPIAIQDIKYDTTIISRDTICGYISKSFVTNHNDSLEVYIKGDIKYNPIFSSKIIMSATDNCIVLSDTLYNNYYKVIDINTKLNVDTIISKKYVKYPFLYLKGIYFCDDNTTIDLVFIVNGIKKKYNLKVFKSKNSKIYMFNQDIWSDEFISNFKNASVCHIRVNQSYCDNEYYTFNFTGSTKAYYFITK